MNHAEFLRRIAVNEVDLGWNPDFCAGVHAAADHMEALEALVNALDIQVMHPSMDGRHQCSIRANGRLLTTEQWDLILTCRFGDVP